MGWDLLAPEMRGAVVAVLVTLAIGAGGRLLKRPRLAAWAAGIGLAAGFAVVLGVVTASPRQLAERLPLLALLVLGCGAVASVRPRAAQLGGTGAGVVGGAWWMAGAPLYLPSLWRIAPEASVLLAAMVFAWRRGAAAAPVAASWVAVTVGEHLAAARGPHTAFALAGAGAAVTAALMRAAPGPASRLVLAVALTGVAAVPVMARAAWADWAAAAAPLLALLAGPWIAARLPRILGAWLGPMLAAAPAIALAAVLR